MAEAGPNPPPPPESALERVEKAERRLEERGAERSVVRERTRIRRERRARYWLIVRTLILPAVLALAGAGAFLITLEASGGDLSGTSGLAAVLIVGVELLGPPSIAAFVSRRDGWFEALAYGLLVFALELALAFGVGFGLLGLGPQA